MIGLFKLSVSISKAGGLLSPVSLNAHHQSYYLLPSKLDIYYKWVVSAAGPWSMRKYRRSRWIKWVIRTPWTQKKKGWALGTVDDLRERVEPSWSFEIDLGEILYPEASQAECRLCKWRCVYMFCIQEIKSGCLWMKLRGRTSWTATEEEREHITIGFSNRTFKKFEMYAVNF